MSVFLRLIGSLQVTYHKQAWRDESLSRPLIEGLHKVGYKTNYGEDGSGFLFLALKRAGGYYLGMPYSEFLFSGSVITSHF